MKLTFEINNQILARTDKNKVVADSRNYLYAEFAFLSEDWNGITKTAIFRKGNKPFKIILDEDNTCLVPWEVLECGTMFVSVFGGDLITTNSLAVSIMGSGYSEGETPSEPTPDVYNQILERIKGLEAGSVTDEQIAEAVEGYLIENPISGADGKEVESIVADYISAHKEELKGDAGENGEDGISPTIEVSKIDGVTTLTITDAEGVKTATVNDGKDVTNEFDGKKILIVGDSVMYGYAWKGGFKNLIEEKYPTATVVNSAVSGACLANNGIYNQVMSTMQDGFVPDIILMDGGANDITKSQSTIELGRLQDDLTTLDTTTVLGSLENLFHTLATYTPEIKVYFMGMWRFTENDDTESANKYMPPYLGQLSWWNNIKACCIKHNVPYIDMFSSGNFNMANSAMVTKYLPSDSQHPSEEGYRRLFPIIEAVINGAPCNTDYPPTNELDGKKILIMGDSLMSGVHWKKGFETLIREKYSCRVKNLATEGATISENGLYNQLSTWSGTTFTPDIILVGLGTADMCLGKTMGTVSSDFDTTTIIGSLEYFLDYVTTNMPSTKVYFVGMYQLAEFSASGYSVPNYAGQLAWWNNIKECCGKYSASYIDLLLNGGINGQYASMRTAYLPDRSYPNEAGYRKLFPVIESAINSGVGI